ncbi:MAG: HNH endonuclease signature motif containing protein [Halobacteriota archaeon]
MTDASALTLHQTGEGYEYVRCRAGDDDATVYIHRLLYVAVHGLDALPSGWHVHHEIPIPWLNTPDNLVAVDPDAHGRYHLQNEPLRADGGNGE